MKVEINLGKEGENPKKETPKTKYAKPGESGVYNRTVVRSKKTGKLEEQGETTSTQIYANDNERKSKAKPGSGSFDGSAAPRVGGKSYVVKTEVGLKGGNKKLLRQSKVRVRKNSASPQAKRSAKKLY